MILYSMAFVVEVSSNLIKPTHIPNILGHVTLSGDETIRGNLLLNQSLTLNAGDGISYDLVDISNVFDILDISNSMNVVGESMLNDLHISNLYHNNQPRFMAYYGPNTNIPYSVIGAYIPYNTLKYGNDYDTKGYAYDVPYDGLYLFTFSFFSNSEPFIVDIQKNNQIIHRCQSNSTTIYETNSFMVYNECLMNDFIVARLVSGSIRLANNNLIQGWHQFTGFKVA